MLIAHTTDLTGDDTSAFVHASALAAASSARLVTVHGNAPHSDEVKLPDAAPLAAKWGRPITHERRCHECCEEVSDTVIDALADLRPELVVLGTHGRHGFAALVHGSVSETIARNIAAPALFVPNRARGFVNAETGAIDLNRIVIPAGTLADAQRGIAAARRLVALAGTPGAALEIVHVGAPVPELANLGATVTRVEGTLEDAILAVARVHGACVIVMPTSGHDGVGDVLLGSHT
jgi:nucleotide-binding universal stress UspA family protein